jgi:GxxExxY protein
MANTRKKLLHEEICDLVLKAFFQVHYELGPGFPESVYAAAMIVVLTELGLHAESEVPTAVYFHGVRVGAFRADVIVESVVLVELKSMRRPHRKFETQILGYLRSTRLEVGLLLYFNPKATFKRIVFSNDRKLLPDLIA